MSIQPRPSPAEVQKAIQSTVLGHFSLIQLGPKDYQDAMDLAVSRNLTSGAIYDALHLTGARSAGCDVLYTLNLRHFRALAPGDPIVVTP